MKGYIFISNGRTVPTEQYQSKNPVKTGSFEGVAIYAANKMGWKLYQGINRQYADELKGVDYDITFYDQNIYRSIFDIKNNLKGYRNLCKMLADHPDIEIIHCNTPIGGVIGRLCGKKYGKKVIYTAHGFHFYKGAPVVNRTIFKWIEQWMAHYTDVLITINKEDYEAAQKFTLKKGGRVFYVPGIGVNSCVFDSVTIDKFAKKQEIGVPADAHLCLGVGDLNDNKNVDTMIKAIAKSPETVHLAICGFGPMEGQLRELCKALGVDERVHFLGFRTDVSELYKASDFLFMASKREGLPRTTMEAMCAGLPCLCSNIRGNIDLIDDGKGGFLISPLDADGFAEAISKLISNPLMCEDMGAYNRAKVKAFDKEVVEKAMCDIFTIFEKQGGLKGLYY